MTDRELMQQALDVMEAAIKAGDWKVDGACDPDWILNALLARLAQPEQEPVARLFGSLPVYDVPTKQEPVAWRTFDGEGGYEYRSYEMNENYAEDWDKRNTNHKGWVEPLYKDPTPCQTCESLARTVMMDQTSHDTQPQRKWQGLTNEEIGLLTVFDGLHHVEVPLLADFIRAIEAKVKEKNT